VNIDSGQILFLEIQVQPIFHIGQTAAASLASVTGGDNGSQNAAIGAEQRDFTS
jgi:hypothetical protein